MLSFYFFFHPHIYYTAKLNEVGTKPLYSITKLNEAGTKQLIQASNGVGVAQVTPNGYISFYGRVNGHGSYYSRVPIDSTTRALTQIGNTTGYNLVASMNSTKSYGTKYG